MWRSMTVSSVGLQKRGKNLASASYLLSIVFFEKFPKAKRCCCVCIFVFFFFWFSNALKDCCNVVVSLHIVVLAWWVSCLSNVICSFSLLPMRFSDIIGTFLTVRLEFLSRILLSNQLYWIWSIIVRGGSSLMCSP